MRRFRVGHRSGRRAGTPSPEGFPQPVAAGPPTPNTTNGERDALWKPRGVSTAPRLGAPRRCRRLRPHPTARGHGLSTTAGLGLCLYPG